MDSLITAAARALARGDPLAALKRVALRDDPPGLALRGMAMAQLGELERARVLLRAAARAFGAHEPMARARCVVAEAEVALAARDLARPAKVLEAARAMLEQCGDLANAAHARLVEVRRLLLIGRLDEAEQALESVPDSAPLPLRITRELIVANIALRRLQTRVARMALSRAQRMALRAGIPALSAEVSAALEVLRAPAARLLAAGEQRMLRLEEVEVLLESGALIVDGCRNVVRQGTVSIRLSRRPILMALACALAEAWPQDVARETLIARAFRLRRTDDSLRARLRVEMARLRRAVRPVAAIGSTPRGFALVPHQARAVNVLGRPVEDRHGNVLALLADGESWSTSALALALGASQRTVQRALESLANSGKAQALGRGRARRWMSTPVPGITTLMLLPATLPVD